eukprot:2608954-Prymnesium_polylepis.2
MGRGMNEQGKQKRTNNSSWCLEAKVHGLDIRVLLTEKLERKAVWRVNSQAHLLLSIISLTATQQVRAEQRNEHLDLCGCHEHPHFRVAVRPCAHDNSRRDEADEQ